MKSILISIRPQWCEKICHKIGKDENGEPIYEKRIEVRKSAPKEVPFKAYVYVTKDKLYLYGDMPIKEFYLDNGGYKGGECNGIKLCNGKVIGEFICNEVEEFHEWELSPQGKFADFERERLEKFLTDACLSEEEVVRYRENLPYCKPLYGWHISDLKIYDKPKELSEFRKPFIDYVSPKESKMVNPKIGISEYVTFPPQSWIYVEELK